MSEYVGWHFLKANCKLGYGDERVVVAGETISVEGTPVICKHGLHACERAIDALKYAPGPMISRVILSGQIVDSGDKAAATHRKTLWIADAERTLHEFACWSAEKALLERRNKGDTIDPRSWAAIEAKRKWLLGEITNQDLAAAVAAARDAAWTAAGDASWTAAWTAAWGAAWAAQALELERRLMMLAPTQ